MHELAHVLLVEEEREVGEQSGTDCSAEIACEDVVHIDRGTVEAEGDGVVGTVRMVRRVVPCLVEGLRDVDNPRMKIASSTLSTLCPFIDRRVGGMGICDWVSILVIYSAVDKDGCDARSP